MSPIFDHGTPETATEIQSLAIAVTEYKPTVLRGSTTGYGYRITECGFHLTSTVRSAATLATVRRPGCSCCCPGKTEPARDWVTSRQQTVAFQQLVHGRIRSLPYTAQIKSSPGFHL